MFIMEEDNNYKYPLPIEPDLQIIEIKKSNNDKIKELFNKIILYKKEKSNVKKQNSIN